MFCPEFSEWWSGISCIKGRGLFLTRKRQCWQTECIALLMVYDLKEETLKAATFANSRELCCPVSRLDYDKVRRLPSIGASKPLTKIYSGSRNMWSDGRCVVE